MRTADYLRCMQPCFERPEPPNLLMSLQALHLPQSACWQTYAHHQQTHSFTCDGGNDNTIWYICIEYSKKYLNSKTIIGKCHQNILKIYKITNVKLKNYSIHGAVASRWSYIAQIYINYATFIGCWIGLSQQWPMKICVLSHVGPS